MRAQNPLKSVGQDFSCILLRARRTVQRNVGLLCRHGLFFLLVSFVASLIEGERAHAVWQIHEHIWALPTLNSAVSTAIITGAQFGSLLVGALTWITLVVVCLRLPSDIAPSLRFHVMFWKNEWRAGLSLIAATVMFALSLVAAYWLISILVKQPVMGSLAPVFGGYATGLGLSSLVILPVCLCYVMVFCTIAYRERGSLAKSWLLFKSGPSVVILTLVLILGLASAHQNFVGLFPGDGLLPGDMSMISIFVASIGEAISDTVFVILLGIVWGSLFMELKEKGSLATTVIAR